MKPWLIDFKDHNILIVGGGNVAYRKTLSFLKEGACVTLLSKKYIQAFDHVHCHKILKEYEFDDLNDYSMVYVATNNKVLNQKIILDAKQKKILCACATPSQSDLKSMATIETNQLILGLTCKETYPAFIHYIEKDIHKYDDLLSRLTSIRRLVIDKDLVDKKNRSLFFYQLMLFEIDELDYIIQSLTHPPFTVHIYTGRIDNTSISFSNSLNALVLSYRDEYFKEKCQVFDLIKREIHIQPMIIYFGTIYDRIQEAFTMKKIQVPLFYNKERLEGVLDYDENRLLLVHSRSNLQFIELLSQFGPVHEFEKPLLHSNYKTIIPFILQEGYHYHHDILNLPIDKLEPVILKNNKIIRYLKEVLSSL